MSAELWVVRLGRMGYEECLELQREVARQRISGAIPQDVLLLVEHPPVVTLGRSSKQKNLISSPEFLRSRGVELFEVERGGDATFHGPGQLVGYPIIDLNVPCGIVGVEMTSIAKETGSFADLDSVGSLAAKHFGAVFDIPAVEH